FLAGLSIIRDERALPTDTPLVLVRAGSVGASPSWLAAGGERFSQANTLDQDIYQLQDNITWAPDWAKGQHRFTVGSSNEFFRFKNVFLQAATGVWAFDCINNTDCPAGDPHSLENGDPSAFQRRFGVSPLQDPGTATFRVAQWGFYAQDEWSPLDNLSVTPGLRIDVPFLSHANSNPALTTNAAFPLDTGKVPSGNILWSPRLGFNWDVDGQANTIVRGGVGIFSGRPPYVWVSNAYSINGLSQVQLTCLPPAGGSLPFKFTADPSKQPTNCSGSTTPPQQPVQQGEIDYFDPNTKYPQNMRIALGADRRLPFDIIGSADLLYTRDVNGWYTTDANLNPHGTDGDGRAIYYAATPTTVGGNIRTLPDRPETQHLTNAVEVYN